MLKSAMGFNSAFIFIKKNVLFSLLLLSIFILKLYSFYPLPVNSVFFASHTIAKAIICFVALIFIIKKRNNIHSIFKKNKIFFLLLTFYLFGQSLSVITTQDLYLFLKFYHNIIISVLIISLACFLYPKGQNNTRSLNKFGIVIGVILTAFELFYIFFPDISLQIINTYIQKEFTDAILSNIQRSKSLLALGPEMFLPFFITPLFDTKTKPKIKFMLATFLLLMFYLSVLSNFRTRILSYAFASILTLLVLIKWKKFTPSIKNWRKLLIPIVFTLLLITIFQLAINTSDSLYSLNIINRLTVQDKYQDLGPIETRINQYFNSIYIFTSSPLIGVGLGNYLNYVNYSHTKSLSINANDEAFSFMSAGRPHNIFIQTLVETGIIGTISLITILLYFLKKDFLIINREQKENYIKGYIISSWAVIFYGLFNPADTVYVMGWFWFSRGIIEAYRSK